MSADSYDNNHEYISYKQHVTRKEREHYWAVASGLQDVDGLQVSEYAKRAAKNYVNEKCSLEETGNAIRDYHSSQAENETAEADLVSVRIIELLERNAFCLVPEILSKIHAYLFQDLNEETYHPGVFKNERLVKQEEILNGDSVLYADPLTYTMSLNAAFNKEASKVYTTFDSDELKSFCHAIAFLWQVHPFYEGNTRTIAVFSEMYLNQLGFSITNEPFEKRSAFYRDALVRSMYRNAAANIYPDDSFLISFYENLLDIKQNILDRETLFCTELFEHPELLKNIDPKEAFHS